MFKKAVKGLLAGAAMLGMVASVQAATYEINIYGASAQHKFWLKLAPSFLTDAAGGNCGSAQQAAYNSKHGIARGLNCDITGGTGDDTILFRYSSRASYKGVQAINDDLSLEMVDDGTCDWTAGTCTALEDVDVNLGASDVAWDDFTQTTVGFEDGNLENDVYADTADYNAPDPNGVDPVYPTAEPPAVFEPIVVPFGFIVNDTVCKFRCVKPTTWNDADGPVTALAYAQTATYSHKAYSKDMWECDPNESDASGHNPQCIGYYKCIDHDKDGTTTCQGGTNSGNTCDDSEDCPDVALSDTRCEAMPLDNVNDVMVGQIFSGQVTLWKDFGPYFDCPIDADGDGEYDDDQAIIVGMRHGGSGTHATMDDLVQPYTLATTDAYLGNLMVGDSAYPQGYNRVHFTSSSDLTEFVADFAGAIGYVDADKLLGYDDLVDGIADGPTEYYDEADGIIGAHLVKYNGVEPTRQKILNGEYGFWAAQHVYYDESEFATTPMATLLSNLEDYSSDAANLTTATLGATANFWAAQSEMTVKKSKKTNVTKQIVVQK